MTITSLTFLIFVFMVIVIYYLIPKKFQWIILLAASIIFYLYSGIKSAVFILVTSVSIYFTAYIMQKITDRQKAFLKENKGSLTKEEKQKYKNKNKTIRRSLMIVALLLNFGLLCVVKYFHFALEQVNSIISLFGFAQIEDTFNLIIPLGISFYTFQSTGYLIDVYWENCRAEKNYFKILLFISFFPQVTQGPISNFEQLSDELFSEHKFEYRNYARGFQRMVWGFFKKMLLANILAPYVQDVFANYSQYSGITVFIGALMYSVQIYADFSGYMDIMCGLCEILGIHLTENFERPYFSKSIAEYWRRWHISLGAWFKKYVYFPIGMSKWNRKLAAYSKDKLGKRFADTVPASVALVVVWLATGLWHGASWAYITWGLVNGLFIILSMWMDPVYEKWKRILNIDDSIWLWRAYQTLRTFILVTFIKVLPEVGTLSQGVGLIKRIFTNYTIPKNFSELLPFIDNTMGTAKINFVIAIFATILLFICSMLQRKKPVRDYFNRFPMPVRVFVLCAAVLLISAFGVQASWGAGGFLYAQF